MRVEPARIERDLAALIEIPSVTGEEEAVQARMAELMADAGLEVSQLFADPGALSSDPAYPGAEAERTTLPVVAGRLRSPRPGPTVVLAGHLDVVPPGDRGAWTADPFTPVVRDGRMYGRGACDMKGGVVAALEALRALADRAVDRAGDVVLLTVPSEEDGGAGMLAAIRAGWGGDLAVIPEPTRLRVVTAHAGALTFRLRVPGRGAHAATRRAGVSALEKLEGFTAALRDDEARRNADPGDARMAALELPYPTIIGRVRGGDWASTVMDGVVAEGRYGVRLGQTCAHAEADLRAVVEGVNAGDPFLREHPATVEIWGGRFASASLPPGHPLPESLAAAAHAETGAVAAKVGVPYGADMRLLIQEAGVPCVMYGPGDVRRAHTADEYVPLDEVGMCARVLARWLSAPSPLGQLSGG